MQDDTQQRFCYAASHMVIISGHHDPHQTTLQGHCQPVSCLATSVDRSVIVSADSGPDSLMVLWDVKTATPFWSVSKPHPYGVVAMQLFPDARQLVALSGLLPGGSEQQIMSVWDLSNPTQTPSFSALIPAGDAKSFLCLSNDGKELITNGSDHVCFWELTASTVSLATSPTRSQEFKEAKHATGDFTISSYLPDGLQVILSMKFHMASSMAQSV